MDDLARASGISRPTLSKFFDDPTSVRPTTRQRIEAALAGSDYRPNPFARNLNRRRSRTIGVVVPTVADPFYAALVGQLEKRCHDGGYWPLLLSSHGTREGEARAFETLLDQRVSGALVASSGTPIDARLAETVRRRIPLVFMDSAPGIEAAFVGNDNRQSIEAMVDFMASDGAAPAYLDMPDVNANAAERRSSYLARMDCLGIEPQVITPDGRSWDFERLGFEAMEAVLANGAPPFRGLLCANDRLALGALASAHTRGLHVGMGRGAVLRLAGHDDHPLSRFACPALTTMAQDVDAMAETAANMLLRSVREQEPLADRVLLPAELTRRASA